MMVLELKFHTLLAFTPSSSAMEIGFLVFNWFIHLKIIKPLLCPHTVKFQGGVTGRVSGLPFSLTGDIRDIFGRSGEVLNAVGFYMNASLPFSSYNKTDFIAGANLMVGSILMTSKTFHPKM